MKCSTFRVIGKTAEAMKIGDITANYSFEFGADNLMTLEPSAGRTDKIYTYLTAERAQEIMDDAAAGGTPFTGLLPGWYQLDFVEGSITTDDPWDWCSPIPEKYSGNNVELPYGTMVIVQTGSDEATVNYAGEVISKNYQFELVSGIYNMIGNATPVDLTLGDITANYSFEFGADNLMTLETSAGRTDKIFTYLTAERAKEIMDDAAAGGTPFTGLLPGWYQLDFVEGSITTDDPWDWCSPIPEKYCGNSLPIPSGYGFIVQTGSDEAVIEIPTPLE